MPRCPVPMVAVLAAALPRSSGGVGAGDGAGWAAGATPGAGSPRAAADLQESGEVAAPSVVRSERAAAARRPVSRHAPGVPPAMLAVDAAGGVVAADPTSGTISGSGGANYSAYYLGPQGDSCEQACRNVGLLCSAQVETGYERDRVGTLMKRLKTFEPRIDGCTMEARDSPFGPNSARWWSDYQPCYVTGEGNQDKGACTGFKSVPRLVPCEGHHPDVRRVCHCANVGSLSPNASAEKNVTAHFAAVAAPAPAAAAAAPAPVAEDDGKTTMRLLALFVVTNLCVLGFMYWSLQEQLQELRSSGILADPFRGGGAGDESQGNEAWGSAGAGAGQ